MTTPASNDADKPATTTNTNKTSNKSSGSGLKVRLLAKSWLCPVEDDKGRITWYRYSQGDELEVTEDTFELLSGPEAFKPAFQKLEADA